MDGHRFDDLTLASVLPSGRRKAVAGLLSGMTAVLLGTRDETAGRRR
jgi:hypothetical protein